MHGVSQNTLELELVELVELVVRRMNDRRASEAMIRVGKLGQRRRSQRRPMQ